MNKEDLHGPQKRLIDVQQQSNRQTTNEGNEEHCFTRLECPQSTVSNSVKGHMGAQDNI